MLSPFSPAFLRGEEGARAFLRDDFRDAGKRAAHVRQAGTRRVSEGTLAALRAQSAALPLSAARDANLEQLALPGTCVVVTGQQVGLFLGPLYAFYKAASAIAVARALSTECGVRCVPVFWLQSEDHDFQEINHCHVLGVDDQLHRPVIEGADDRTSISTRALGEAVLPQLDALASALEGTSWGSDVMALLRAHYRPDLGWVRAFAGVMSELFASEGLLLVDPREPLLAQQTRSVHLRALEEHEAISGVLLARQAALEAAGFAAQVHVRPHAPLSFFHPEGADGPRYRLEPRGAGWGLVGATQTFSTEQLRAAAPGCFSSSALLRPIVQDSLFPTAAIVGGPGELNYFAQLEPLYAHFGLPMPMAVPRARFRVLEARPRAWLEQLKLNAVDVERPRDEVLAQLRPAETISAEAIVKRAHQALDPLMSEIPATDPDVVDAITRTRGTIDRALSRLAGRHARSLSRRDEVTMSRLERVQRVLFPHAEPQERVFGWPSFASRLGIEPFKDLVFTNLEPFAAEVRELRP